MTNFADSLKREIALVARKELRDEITALRKTNAVLRGEVSALKKQTQVLQTEVRKLSRLQGRRHAEVPPEVEARAAAPAKGRPGRKVLFTAERLKAQRARLGFTQQQMAKLLGVSSLSVWKWETGAAAPRAWRVPQLLQRLSLGKREALALVGVVES